MTSPSPALDSLTAHNAFGVDLSSLVPPGALPVIVVRHVSGEVPPVFTDAYHVRLHVFCGEQQIPVELEKDQYEGVCTHFVAYVDVTATAYLAAAAAPPPPSQETTTTTTTTTTTKPLPYLLWENLSTSERQRLEAAHPAAERQLVPVGTIRLRAAAATSALGAFPEPLAKLERLCVVHEFRRYKLGALLVATLEEAARVGLRLPAVVLHGQTAVEGFYKRCGYRVVSDVFVEDGIDHVGMRKDFEVTTADV